MTTNQDKRYEDIASGADIYGGYGILDEQDKMLCIEVRYHCNNCHCVMFKDVNTDIQSKEPIKCLFCKLTVYPLQLH